MHISLALPAREAGWIFPSCFVLQYKKVFFRNALTTCLNPGRLQFTSRFVPAPAPAPASAPAPAPAPAPTPAPLYAPACSYNVPHTCPSHQGWSTSRPVLTWGHDTTLKTKHGVTNNIQKHIMAQYKCCSISCSEYCWSRKHQYGCFGHNRDNQKT